MTEQERLERRIRFAEAMGWERVQPSSDGYVGFPPGAKLSVLLPNPDTNSDDRWALLEWFIRQPYVSDLRMWVYPAVSKKPGVFGVYANLPYPNIPNCEADTLTEALLQAIDAALLAGKEGK